MNPNRLSLLFAGSLLAASPALKAAATELPETMPLFDAVQTVFDASCVECHGAEKSKGKLRMDSFEAIQKGGSEEGFVIPKDVEGSLLWFRVTLPTDDDEFMPPTDSGHKPLNKPKLALIKQWIEAGADNTTMVASADLDANLRKFLLKQLNKPKDVEKPLIIGGLGVEEWAKQKKNIDQALAKVPDTGASLMPLSINDPQLRLNVVNVWKEFGDEQLKQMQPVVDYLVWADLARSQVSDAGLALLAKMPRLERIHLQNTSVTTEGVKQLAQLEHLKLINLHGTQVDDQVLDVLAGMPSLEAVYLWGTQVTPEAAKALRAKMPDTHINIGWEHEPPVKVSEAVPEEPAEPEQAKELPAEVPVFAAVVQPMFEAHCTACHGADKQKGKLRLDSFDAIMKGGKEGAAIVASKPDDSPIFQRVSLPHDDDDFMPPTDSDQKPLPKEAVAFLKEWIAQGAAKDTQIATASLADPVKALVQP